MSGRHRPRHLSVSPPSPPFRGAGGGANRRPFPLQSLSHARPDHPPVSRRTVRSPRPTHSPAPRTPYPHTLNRRWDSRPHRATDMQPLTRLSECLQHGRLSPTYPATTIPFGRLPPPETTRLADTHYHNEKETRQLAKRNPRPAVGLPQCDSPTNRPFFVSSPHRLIAFIAFCRQRVRPQRFFLPSVRESHGGGVNIWKIRQKAFVFPCHVIVR